MIVPTEAVIKLISSNGAITALVGTRIAVLHRFGEVGGWTKGQSAMTVRRDGGEPEHDLERDRSRYEVRLYGKTALDREKLFLTILQLIRATMRAVVTITDGKALISECYIATNPTSLYDPDIDDQVMLFFLHVTVSEEAVL